MQFAYKISGFNRLRKWKKFQELIQPTSESSILDVGYTDEEFSETDNFLEKNYPYPQNITALGIEEPKNFKKKYPIVKVITHEGGKFPFRNKQFDICWSNAVLEHVGNREKQVLFLKEADRVARKVFLTTPNKYFPIEVHTRTPLVHFLPRKFFDKYLMLTGKEWAAGGYMNLLSLRDIKKLLKDAEISNYKIIKNKLLFFTLDFIVIFGDNIK